VSDASNQRPNDGKPHRTIAGRVVYYRKPHAITIKDVIRMLQHANWQFDDIIKINETIRKLVDGIKEWIEKLVRWVYDLFGGEFIYPILKGIARDFLQFFRDAWSRSVGWTDDDNNIWNELWKYFNRL